MHICNYILIWLYIIFKLKYNSISSHSFQRQSAIHPSQVSNLNTILYNFQWACFSRGHTGLQSRRCLEEYDMWIIKERGKGERRDRERKGGKEEICFSCYSKLENSSVLPVRAQIFKAEKHRAFCKSGQIAFLLFPVYSCPIPFSLYPPLHPPVHPIPPPPIPTSPPLSTHLPLC